MGISAIVTIPSTILLGSFIGLRNVAPSYILIPILQASLVGFTAALAAHPALNKTGLFGKSAQGEFPWWSYATFYPYLFGLRAYVLLRRMKSKEPVYDEVSPGLFVGGWPTSAGDLPPGNPAVVDCTCELPRQPYSIGLPYLNIPTWDSRGPKPEDIELAVRWAMSKRAQDNRPVYIHCAFGHGRSVAVMCALLVALNIAPTWSDAEQLIKIVRPRARLNKPQRESLQQWRKFTPLETFLRELSKGGLVLTLSKLALQSTNDSGTSDFTVGGQFPCTINLQDLVGVLICIEGNLSLSFNPSCQTKVSIK